MLPDPPPAAGRAARLPRRVRARAGLAGPRCRRPCAVLAQPAPALAPRAVGDAVGLPRHARCDRATAGSGWSAAVLLALRALRPAARVLRHHHRAARAGPRRRQRPLRDPVPRCCAYGYAILVSSPRWPWRSSPSTATRAGGPRHSAVAACVLENIGYRQLTVWWRLQGWWASLRGARAGVGNDDPHRLRTRPARRQRACRARRSSAVGRPPAPACWRSALLLLFPRAGRRRIAVRTCESRARDVQALTLSLGPALDANNALLLRHDRRQRRLERAGRWRIRPARPASGSSSARRIGDLTAIDAGTPASPSSAERPPAPRTPRAGHAQQRREVDAWFARRAGQAARGRPARARRQSARRIEAGAPRRFSRFRDTNRTLDAGDPRTSATQARDRFTDVDRLPWPSSSSLTALAALVVTLVAPEDPADRCPARWSDCVTWSSGSATATATPRPTPSAGAPRSAPWPPTSTGSPAPTRSLQEQQAQVLLAAPARPRRRPAGAQRRPTSTPPCTRVCAMLGEGLRRRPRAALHARRRRATIDGADRSGTATTCPTCRRCRPRSRRQRPPAVNDELRREASGLRRCRTSSRPRCQTDDRPSASTAPPAPGLLMVPVGVGRAGPRRAVPDDGRRATAVAPPRDPGRPAVRGLRRASPSSALRLTQMSEEQVRRGCTELDRQKTDFMATVSPRAADPADLDQRVPRAARGRRLRRRSRPPQRRGPRRSSSATPTRLRGLIEDLLVLNKIEATGLAGRRGGRRSATWCAGVAEMLRPVAEPGECSLGRPTSSTTTSSVRVDRGSWSAALINLGSNAVKFTPRGRHRDAGRLRGRRARGDQRLRHRHRHPASGPGAGCSAGSSAPRNATAAGDPRHRARAGHRQGHRRGPRRRAGGRLRRGGGDHDAVSCRSLSRRHPALPERCLRGPERSPTQCRGMPRGLPPFRRCAPLSGTLDR